MQQTDKHMMILNQYSITGKNIVARFSLTMTLYVRTFVLLSVDGEHPTTAVAKALRPMLLRLSEPRLSC